MKPGVYPAMPEDEYRATSAVSCSTLKRFAEAPAKAHIARPDSDAMCAGRLIHSAVLEAFVFETRHQRTEIDRRGTKAWLEAEAEAAEAGKLLVKAADYDAALRVRDAVMAHKIARAYLAPGLLPEASVFWEDGEAGLVCRARMDGIRPADRAIVDVKTTMDAGPDDFARSVAKFRHHWQAAFYSDGLALAPGGFKSEAFVFVAVERDAPHLIAVYELSPMALHQGRREVRTALQGYAECARRGVWPGYPEQIVMLDLPEWAMEEEYVS